MSQSLQSELDELLDELRQIAAEKKARATARDK